MAQKAHRPETRPVAAQQAAAREGGFKPLGIPALAAAVNAASRQPHKAAQRDLPAILRNDGFVD